MARRTTGLLKLALMRYIDWLHPVKNFGTVTPPFKEKV